MIQVNLRLLANFIEYNDLDDAEVSFYGKSVYIGVNNDNVKLRQQLKRVFGHFHLPYAGASALHAENPIKLGDLEISAQIHGAFVCEKVGEREVPITYYTREMLREDLNILNKRLADLKRGVRREPIYECKPVKD